MNRTIAAVVALFLFAGAAARAEDLGPPKRKAKPVVTWTIKNSPLAGAPGETVKLELHADIPNGYHTYTTRVYPPGGPIAAPPTFAFDPKEIMAVDGAVRYSLPKIQKTEEGDVEIFEKEATFTLPLKIAASAPAGEQNIKLLIDSQVCDEHSCVPAYATPVAFVLNVGGKASDTATKPAIPAKPVVGLDLKGLKGLDVKSFDLAGLKPAKAAVKWTVKNSPLSGARGEVLKLELYGEIPAGYHTYPSRKQGPGTSPTHIAAADGAPFKVEDGIVDPPTTKNHEFNVLEKEATFIVPISIATTTAPGAYPTKLVISSQVCNEKNCTESPGIEVPFVLNVSDATPVAAVPKADKPSSSAGQGGVDDIAKARAEGFFAFLKVAISAGYLALLTPCVFPMIPITVSFFTKRKQSTRQAAIRDAGIYALGIVSAFVVLGLFVTLIMGASGVRDLSTNPYANTIVAAIFVALAFSLFGAFEIQVPPSLMNKLNKKADEGSGVFSVLLMGAVFALTSFTCTVPFVGSVLVYATQGDYFWALAGTAAFATAFASPFLVLALFPSLLKKLPKSGGWMNSVKVVMGFIELAAALKFISNIDLAYRSGILTREVFLAAWIALALMIVFYLLGKFQMAHDSPVERIGAARATFATVFLGLAIWLVAGLFGMKLGELDALVPARIYPGQTEPSFSFGSGGGKSEELTWNEDYDAALAEAKKKNLPLFIDFTGDQCTNCRLMEQNIFPRPEIRALLGQFVRAKLVTDRKSGPDRERSIRYVKMQEERFNTASLPFYVILSPKDEVIATFDGFTRDASAYEAFLKKGAAAGKVQTAWYDNFEDGLADAKARCIPILLKFDGCNSAAYTSPLFAKPEIEQLLQNFVLVELNKDAMDRKRVAQMEKMQEERFNNITEAFSVILSPDNEPLITFEGMTRDVSKYAEFLKSGLSAKANSTAAAR